jgi:ribosomal-protein-alanine N-acetyltransferase
MITYSENKATVAHIQDYLTKNANLFSPPLDVCLDIAAYAQKIRQFAYTVEAWSGSSLIGLIACYLNNTETQAGFITHISVMSEYQRNHIGHYLMKTIITIANTMSFKEISLEVDCRNDKAISLYKKCGFVLLENKVKKYVMIKYLHKTDAILFE